MRGSLSIFSSSGRKRHAIAVSIGRASMRKGQEDSREDCAIIPHHISWNIKWLAQFLGVSPQHGKAGEGGKLPLEHARILKNGAVNN